MKKDLLGLMLPLSAVFSCFLVAGLAAEGTFLADVVKREVRDHNRPSEHATVGNCEIYAIQARGADSDARKKLLSDALACLEISGPHVSKEDAEILGCLVCDLDASYITASGQNLLEQLKQRRSFSPEQAEAIRALLSSGSTRFGPPSTWSTSTLQDLSGLVSTFDRNILQSIPKDVVTDFLHNSPLLKKHLADLVAKVRPSRRKRASECPKEKTVTDEVAQEGDMPIDYDVEQLRACFRGETLVKYLGTVSYDPFTEEQVAVIMENLDEVYPDGYPDSVVRNLGNFLDITAENIQKWNITSPETLAFLLAQSPSDDLNVTLVHQYIKSGGPLCSLTQDELKMIEENAFKEAKPLNISECSQTTKDILYLKAKRAFSDRHNEGYYDLIKPYLGGAPGEDLKALSKDRVNMDIDTFMHLRNDSVLELTASEVNGLLRKNVKDLKSRQYEYPLSEWIPMQKQSDLDTLGIGLQGGTPNGYINIAPRRSGASALLAGNLSALHIFPTLLPTLLMTFFLS